MAVRFLIVVGTAVALSAALPATTAGATPPDGDAVRTDIAKGTTETPVSITTDGPTTLVVQSLVLPHRVANELGSDAQVVLTYTLPVDAPVRGDAPDVCAN
jgi:hypothetical protein